jgi:hypothetical protein
MKATTTILTVVLTLSMDVLFASNDGAAVNSETNSVLTLAPSTPSEATFEEMTEATATLNLAPVTPKEADFSDVAPQLTIDHLVLVPVTPSEADFSDDEIPMNNVDLTPITPEVADFNETI